MFPVCFTAAEGSAWKIIGEFSAPKQNISQRMKLLAGEVFSRPGGSDAAKNLYELHNLCIKDPDNLQLFFAFVQSLPIGKKEVVVKAGSMTCKIPLASLCKQVGILSAPNSFRESMENGTFEFGQKVVEADTGKTDLQLSEDLLNCIANQSSQGILSESNAMGLLIFAIDYKITWLLDDCVKFLITAYKGDGDGEGTAEFLNNLGHRAFDSEVSSRLTQHLIHSMSKGNDVAQCLLIFNIDKIDKSEKEIFFTWIVSHLNELSISEKIEFLQIMGPPQELKPSLFPFFQACLEMLKRNSFKELLSEEEILNLQQLAKSFKLPDFALISHSRDLQNYIEVEKGKTIIKCEGFIDPDILTLLKETKNAHYHPEIALHFDSKQGIDISEINPFLEENVGITSADLSNHRIGNKQVKELANALRSNETLTSLDLAISSITTSGATDLVGVLSTHRALAFLDLSGNAIKDAGAQAVFKAFEENTVLKTLRLVNCKITDVSAIAIEEFLSINSTLEKLHLGNNALTGDGIKTVARGLTGNKRLTYLNLSDNPIRNEGARAIFRALEVNSTLKEFNFNHTRLTDEIMPDLLDFLEKNKTIETIVLQYSGVSEENRVKIDEILASRKRVS